MKTKLRHFTDRAFTLIELLVVIAIIGVLAGMFFPVLKTAQEKARRVTCMNNLSQFGKGLVMYAMDHDDRAPTNLISMATVDYMPTPKLFHCRSDRWRETADDVASIEEASADKYCSYNLVTRETSGARVSASSPSTMAVIFDKDGQNGNVTADGFGGNHSGNGGHILFGDASVSWIKASSWSSNVWGVADLASVVGY